MAGNWAVSSYSGEFSFETKQNLRELYLNRCSVCEQKRVSPYGHPEVEAAHIHPAQHGGPNRETNGLLLCRRCHWGFDSGWLGLEDDHTIIVADEDAAHGYEYFQQFGGKPLLSPTLDDLQPEPRFIQVHRRLFGFESLVSGDVLTIGGLRDSQTRLVDGRRLIIEGGEEDALVVNCRVSSVGTQTVRCEHQTTLEKRPETVAEPADPRVDTQTDPSLEGLEKSARTIKSDYSGVEQKWEWGRLFRTTRAQHGLSRAEIAAKLPIDGTSKNQIQRAERVYDMFPNRDFEGPVLSFSAIAELQRAFPQPEDARAVYDCIAATGVELSVWETRAWVELLLDDVSVTRETVQQSLEEHPSLSPYDHTRGRKLDTHIQHILTVHAASHSTVTR